MSIDARRSDTGHYEAYSDFGAKPTGLVPAEWARTAQGLGAGEVLITSIERDGWLQGYDLELCRSVADAVTIPTLVLGGAGNWDHFIAGFEEGHASAVCSQNIHHFSETSIRSAKVCLSKAGISVRL